MDKMFDVHMGYILCRDCPMEMVSSILELGKMILAPIRKYYNYHKDVDKHMNNLKNKWEELKCRMMDTESKMGAELFPICS